LTGQCKSAFNSTSSTPSLTPVKMGTRLGSALFNSDCSNLVRCRYIPFGIYQHHTKFEQSPYQHDIPATLNSPAFSVTPTTTQRSTTDLTGRTEEMSDGDGDVDAIPSSPQHGDPATLGSSVIPVTTPPQQTASEIAGETSEGDDVDATPSPYQHDIPATLNSPAPSAIPTQDQDIDSDSEDEDVSDNPSSRQEAENGIRERLLRRWRQRFNDCHQQNIDITFEQFSREVLAAANLILSKPPLERLQRLPRDQHQNPPPTEPTTL